MEREAGGTSTRQLPAALGSAASGLLLTISCGADQQTASINNGQDILILIGVTAQN